MIMVRFTVIGPVALPMLLKAVPLNIQNTSQMKQVINHIYHQSLISLNVCK